MQFLVLFGIIAVFAAAFPKIFKGCYWMLMLPLFTVGPASILHTASWIFRCEIPFSLCCIVSFIFCAVPFMKWTAPE